MGSLLDSAKKWGRLTAKQHDVFQRIERKTDPAHVKAVADWRTNFTDDMREALVFAANYYKANPPYYGDVADRILNDSSYIPSEKLYRKMVENKYATKVIENTLAEPKFNTGSHVMLRSTAHISVAVSRDERGTTSRKGKLGMVLKADAKPVSSPARGSKVYSVLFFGETQPAFIEERWLKKGKA